MSKKLIISVDYDGTYSAAPSTFDMIITEFQANGHTCIIVTARDKDLHPVNVNTNLALDVYYTSGELKDPFMAAKGIEVDIWIEDRPQSVGKTDNWKFDKALKQWYQDCDACSGIGTLTELFAGPEGEEVYAKGACSDCEGSGRWVPE